MHIIHSCASKLLKVFTSKNVNLKKNFVLEQEQQQNGRIIANFLQINLKNYTVYLKKDTHAIKKLYSVFEKGYTCNVFVH